MTTIAFRDGVVAADSRASSGEWIADDCARKLSRAPDGGVIGFAGSWGALAPLVRWLAAQERSVEDLDGKKRPRPGDEAGSVVWVRHNGMPVVFQEGGWFEEPAPYSAWGSGWVAAMAVLHMGADAARAVEIAALLDAYTGGEIVTMRVGGP